MVLVCSFMKLVFIIHVFQSSNVASETYSPFKPTLMPRGYFKYKHTGLSCFDYIQTGLSCKHVF